MAKLFQKLELTWIGKGDDPELEPRILIEDSSASFGDIATENMLIHGDNLLALKALEQQYSGTIKCVCIDPPYNTGSAFEYYDDGVEHSQWLNLIKPRLIILRKLLKEDGSIWIAIDDNEVHYLKVLCDEIFGRNNFVGCVVWQHSIQGKNDAKTFSLHHNYILVYSKSDKFQIKKQPREEKHNKNYSNPDNDPKGEWRSGDFRSPNYRANLIYDIITPSGKKISAPANGWRWSKDKVEEKIRSGEIIFSKHEDKIIRKIYLSEQDGRVAETIWFGDDAGTTREANTELKQLNLDAIFDTPKPERLIKKILELATNEGDIIIDSFLGSGTSAAVAHKMNRRWIGIELGEHAKTLCLPRLKKVVSGIDDGGISNSVDWKGGGGFRFYSLAQSLILKDKYGDEIINPSYNPTMLAAAMAKQEGFRYCPNENIYWKQGTSSEKDFIYTTTQFVTVEMLDRLADEMIVGNSLLVCCKSYAKGCVNRHSNITIKKIPQMLLGRCEFGKDDYSLNIVNMPKRDVVDLELIEPDDLNGESKQVKKKSKKAKPDNQQSSLF